LAATRSSFLRSLSLHGMFHQVEKFITFTSPWSERCSCRPECRLRDRWRPGRAPGTDIRARRSAGDLSKRPGRSRRWDRGGVSVAARSAGRMSGHRVLGLGPLKTPVRGGAIKTLFNFDAPALKPRAASLASGGSGGINGCRAARPRRPGREWRN
jgi:hypothetical protein